MAILNVPGKYSSVSAAVLAARTGDTVKIGSNYTNYESVDLSKNNLIFDVTGNSSVSIKLKSGLAVTLKGDGSMSVYGSAGNDVIRGNDGKNYFSIDSGGDDSVDGGGGNDVFDVGLGKNTVNGGSGDDEFRIHVYKPEEGTGRVDGGSGADRVIGYSLGQYSIINIEELIVSHKMHFYPTGSYYYGERYAVAASASQLASFSKISAQATGDEFVFNLNGAGGTVDFSTRLAGTAFVTVDASAVTAGVTVVGTKNADSFVDSKYGDTFDGGAGADSFRSRGGFDVFKGGAGDDVFRVDGTAGRIDGGADIDTVVATNLGRYVFSNVEVLETRSVKASAAQLSAFATIIDRDSTDRAIEVSLTGAGGSIDFSRKIVGDNALDFDASKAIDGVSVVGSINDDILRGSDFDDRLDGRGGADILIGGQGDDVFVTDGRDTLVEAANFGTDTVLSSASLSLARNLENLTLTGQAGLRGTGNGLDNVLVGNAGANTLDGKLGSDVMRGNAGADTFVFSTALNKTNIDHIVDFVAKDDTITLTKAGVFLKLTAGQALSASQFKDITSSSAKLDADDYIQYDRNTGALFYDADGSGRAAAVQFAVLDNRTAISAADFFVV